MNYKKQKLALAILMGVGVSLFGCGGGGGDDNGGGGGDNPTSPDIAPNNVAKMNDKDFQNYQTSVFGMNISAEVAADNLNKCIAGRDCLLGANIPPATTTDESTTQDEIHPNKCVGAFCFGEMFMNETNATLDSCTDGEKCVENVCLGTSDECEDNSASMKDTCEDDDNTNNCDRTSASTVNQLGAIYTKNKTTFRIWSPKTDKVTLKIEGDTNTYNLVKLGSLGDYEDVYEVVVNGDLDGRAYQFYLNGQAVRDPYARMTVTNGSDSQGNIKYKSSIVMNLENTDPVGGWAKRPELKNREDSIVYEVHVRDFTIDSSSGVSSENRGRYLGMVETGTTNSYGKTTGIDHLKELGVTHVQILPIYDYATCQDVNSQSDKCYNWGYDPLNYNVPEDRYSAYHNTALYKAKVKEFKEMINEFHKNGIRVIMDVVYNHTYKGDVYPEFYYGADLSGCGNGIDAKKGDMVSKMIRDSLEYWITEYNIDGFRFDLVGVFDVDVYSSWGKYINDKYPERNILMYGEPWQGSGNQQNNKKVRTGTVHSQEDGAYVGVFNNRIRNCLRGGNGNDATDKGFIFGVINGQQDDNGTDENDVKIINNQQCVELGMQGGVRSNDATGTDIWSAAIATSPYMSVSYVTCHDNLSFMDRILDLGISGQEKFLLQSYAHAAIFLSQGIPFIQGGEEIGRDRQAATGKEAHHNAYNSGCFVNGKCVNDYLWDQKNDTADGYAKVSDYLSEIIKIRKEHPAFRLTSNQDVLDRVKVVKPKNLSWTTEDEKTMVILHIDGEGIKGETWKDIYVFLNSTKEDYKDFILSGYTRAVSGMEVTNDSSVVAKKQSVTIWYKE
jgi:pullulanase/glycogen debranching enzyme